MALYDRVFPPTPHPRLVQTQWAPDWGAATSGFGYAAALLTRHRTDFGAMIDQAGIAIIYLQRHRVELALKDLLHAITGHAPSGHNLDKLWKRCEQDLAPLDAGAWAQFAQHRELVDVLHAVDESSTVFRYPANQDGSKVNRPDFVDLDVLDEAADQFEFAAAGYVDYWTEGQRAGP